MLRLVLDSLAANAAQSTGTESAQNPEDFQLAIRTAFVSYRMKKRPRSTEPYSSRSGQSSKQTPKDVATATPKPAEADVPWLVAGAILSLAAFCWAYWPTLADMVTQWVRQPDYSHGFLVVPIALFFLWTKRSQIAAEQVTPSMYGLLLLIFCACLRIGAGAFYLAPLDGWTIPLWIAGSVWLLFGWRVLRWCLPSIAFLWFMVPIPFSAESMLSVPLQSVATKLSSAALLMLGQPALAEGNTIWIGGQQLFIEEACSGLRIFVGIFALAFAFILFSRWSWWQKGLALAAVLPIAIVANVTRIVLTGLLYQLVSGDAAKHFSHDFSGLIVIPLAAAMFWLFLIYLDHLFVSVESLSAAEIGIRSPALHTTSASE